MVAISVENPAGKPREYKDLPAYPGHWLRGAIDEMRADPLAMFTRAERDFGPIVRFRLGPLSFLMVTDPGAIHRVLVDNLKGYDKRTRGYEKLRLVLGEGLLTANGDFWKRQRRIANPAFHHERIAGFAETMVDCTEALISRLASTTGAPIDIATEMMRVTLRIVGKTLLSTDVENEAVAVAQALTVTLHRTDELITDPLPFAERWPTERNRAYKRALSVLDRIVTDIIKARRADTTPGKDLLSMLMEARDDETGEGMNDKQLRDEVMTMFLAGHETTANALSWALHLLAENPAARARLHDELDALPRDRSIGLADLPKLPYTAAVVHETLRLFPPAWLIARSVAEHDVLAGHRVKKGTYLLMPLYVVHRSARYWDDPLAFKPDRFLGDVRSLPKGIYLPFIEGARMCIGKSFALMEAQLLLANLARRYNFDSEPGIPVRPEPAITLRPEGGLWMRATARW